MYQNYTGVQITYSGNTIIVYDGTSTSPGPTQIPVALAFQDLIGQPTWIKRKDSGNHVVSACGLRRYAASDRSTYL